MFAVVRDQLQRAVESGVGGDMLPAYVATIADGSRPHDGMR
ncbi:MAG TPA: hypothetical protein VIW24_32590 [Aldersonia sp.]